MVMGRRKNSLLPSAKRATIAQHTVELKRLITKFTYKIEPKPEGGFIAHASDPTLPPLEAPTRLELQQKIQANISAALAAEFPGLKLPSENQQLKFDFHIEAKPGGGFTIRSHDPNAVPIEGATHEEIAHPVAEKLANALGKYMFPELSQALSLALAKQGGSGDIKVFVNPKTQAGAHQLSFSNTQDVQPAGSMQPPDPTSVGVINVADSAPIMPEASNSWKIFRFLLALLVVAAVVYFYLHR
jgi:hypothetical protein